MNLNHKFHHPEGIYFISLTVFGVDIFVRRIYFDCIVEDLNRCVDEYGLVISLSEGRFPVGGQPVRSLPISGRPVRRLTCQRATSEDACGSG